MSPEIIKNGERAPYLSGYYLFDRGDSFGSGMEDHPKGSGGDMNMIGPQRMKTRISAIICAVPESKWNRKRDQSL